VRARPGKGEAEEQQGEGTSAGSWRRPVLARPGKGEAEEQRREGDAEETREAEEWGQRGGSGGCFAAPPALRDGEGLLHFAAGDAAAAGLPTVRPLSAFWGCSILCTSRWR
jgi:hypothetical protein